MAECDLMVAKKFQASINYDAEEEFKKEAAYCVIAPMRCLLMKLTDPTRYVWRK